MDGCFDFDRERDELVGALRAARAGQQEAQEKEWSACLQVKQVVEMAEEANLHKTRVRGTPTRNFTVQSSALCGLLGLLGRNRVVVFSHAG